MDERKRNTHFSNPQPGHDSSRNKAHCRAAVEYFRSLPKDLPSRLCPSTEELIRDGRFGLRPPNRINDLLHGRYDGHRYDFERIKGQGRGEYCWRLHEPARPGYPKHRQQTVLPLEPRDSQPPAPRLPVKPAVEWKDRPRVTGLELWDAGMRP